MSVKLYPLPFIPGYTFKPIRKIYSTHHTIHCSNVRGGYVLNRKGEIDLTRKCDRSLKHQAKKYGGNCVLDAHYSISTGNDTDPDIGATDPNACMYAYGEVVKLSKRPKHHQIKVY